MKNEDEAKELGFKDYDELLLYNDVCCDSLNNPYAPDTVYPWDAEINFRYTKEELTKCIKDNGLEDLFNSVKDLSILDRFLKIHFYFHNRYIISDISRINYRNDLLEGFYEIDQDKKTDIMILINKLKYDEYICVNALDYVMGQAIIRLTDEEREQFLQLTKASDDAKEQYDKNSFGK